jgi:hypothetical protein
MNPNANLTLNCQGFLTWHFDRSWMAGFDIPTLVAWLADEGWTGQTKPPSSGGVRWSHHLTSTTVEVWDTEEERQLGAWRAALRATSGPVVRPTADGRGDRKVAVMTATPEGVTVEALAEPPRRLRRDIERARKALEEAVRRTAYYRR